MCCSIVFVQKIKKKNQKLKKKNSTSNFQKKVDKKNKFPEVKNDVSASLAASFSLTGFPQEIKKYNKSQYEGLMLCQISGVLSTSLLH